MVDNKKYLQLNDVIAYKTAFELSNYIWKIVIKWKYFEKSTVGIQFTKAIDSASANIAEGFGRYSKKDKIKFYRYSFGSVKESCDWNFKSYKRALISKKQYIHIQNILDKLPREINSLIKITNDKLTI